MLNPDLVRIEEWQEQVSFENIRNVIRKAHEAAPEVSFNTDFVTENDFVSRLEPGGAVFVAIIDDKIVGTMMINIEKCNLWYGRGKTAALRFLAVLPAYSGKGIASKLVGECLKWSKKNSVNTVLWTTAFNNYAAIRTAHKNSFNNVDFLKFRGIQHPSVRMAIWNEDAPSRLFCAVYFFFKKKYIHLRLFWKNHERVNT